MAEAVLKRKLDVLGCPFASEVERSDERSLQRLINWLEDVHIRRWTPKERAPLRREPFAPAFESYIGALDVPSDAARDPARAVPFLLDVALSLHYDDCADVYNVPVDPWAGRVVPEVSGAASDAEVLRASHSLLASLGVDGADLNAADAVTVAADVVDEHFSMEDVGDKDGLDSLPLGFATGDATVDRVATVLRLLHVRELRKLQDVINDSIAGMQAVTANPRTDVKQGRVGR